jgi:taurine dioxygenase
MRKLSDGMKAMLGGLTAIHSVGRIYGVNRARSLTGLPSSMTIRYTEEAHSEIEHPVVRTHVETGRKCLYVNGNFTVRFKDMTEEESAPLLSWLNMRCGRNLPVASGGGRIRSRSGTTVVSSTTP